MGPVRSPTVNDCFARSGCFSCFAVRRTAAQVSASVVAGVNVLTTVRPYIRMIDSTIGTEAMTNGDICIALTYNSDMAFARMRAEEANKGAKKVIL